MNAPSQSRLLAWLRRNRWLIVIALTALAIRLHWNLDVHPLGDFISSDMRGYDSRADQFIADPWKAREYHGFFPYGTHYLVALFKVIFGKDNYPAISACYAVMGTFVVILGYLIARRVSKRAWVPPAVGLILACYYPLISLGGYILSEVPMSMFMGLGTLFLLRLIEEGRSRDAWGTGLAIAAAMVIRPQVLLSVALFGIAWLFFRRRSLAKVKIRHLVFAAIPLVLTLGYSAWRLHHHTGRTGLISENGTFNQVFGHCHTKMITANGTSTIKFGPPPMIQLHRRAETHPDSWIKLDPAIAPELTFKGYIADQKILKGYLRECWKKKGLLGQAKYTAVNLVLLVAHNTMWPDSGRAAWRETAKWWGRQHLTFLTLPAFIGMFTAFSRRTIARHGILAIHLWALMITAAIFFGDTRLRCPYDPFIVILALEVYGWVGQGVLRWFQNLRARRQRRALG
ncbi:MAG: glycosyltransferase family 39 protein [Myxococcales bacterium]|nr:glycosyltransferase family 39 protein [Myxococcales bacterium]